MKSAPDQTASESALAATARAKFNPPLDTLPPSSAAHDAKEFAGTDNPRHLRAIALLWERPAKRSEIDDRAGCLNGPELIAELRRRGLSAPCERIKCLDRDGYPCRPGIYSFTTTDRRKLTRWMATRKRV